MNFLSNILQRAENERPFLLIRVGYPATDTDVPMLKRKSLDEIVHQYNKKSCAFQRSFSLD
jgi:hypothetical protein